MVGGQVEDLAFENANHQTLANLEHVHECKTGALFRACLKLGVYAAQSERPAGPDPTLLARLDTYARCFGLVFQITDDLIDVEGNSADTGKRVQKDAARGKLTYPGLLGAAESRQRARDLTQQASTQLNPSGRPENPWCI